MKSQRAMIRGVLFGWLVGSTIGLVYAPRRGEQTRDQLRVKGLELKEGMNRTLEDARLRSERLVRTSAERTAELIQQGQELLGEQKATVVSTVKGVQAGFQAYTQNRPEDRTAAGSSTYSTENASQPAPAKDPSPQAQDPNLYGDDILDTNTNI